METSVSDLVGTVGNHDFFKPGRGASNKGPSYAPKTYENNKDIKGVYIYLTYTFKPQAGWEDVAKRFCKEELGMDLTGKGSTKRACKMIQEHWGDFVNWTKRIYR